MGKRLLSGGGENRICRDLEMGEKRSRDFRKAVKVLKAGVWVL